MIDSTRPTAVDAGPAIPPPPSGNEPEVKIPPNPGPGDTRRHPPTIWAGHATSGTTLAVLRSADGAVLGTWSEDAGLVASVLSALAASTSVPAYVAIDVSTTAGRLVATELRNEIPVRVLEVSTRNPPFLLQLGEALDHGFVVHHLRALAATAAVSAERAEAVRAVIDRKAGPSARPASIPHTPPPPPLQKWLRRVVGVLMLVGVGVLFGLAAGRQ